MSHNSENSRLLVLAYGGLASGHRVLLASTQTKNARYGLLTSKLGEWQIQQMAVQLCPLPQVPANVVGIGRALADRMGIAVEGSGNTWHVDAISTVRPVEEICLETMEESDFETVVQQLSRSNDLTGRPLWIPDTGRPEPIEVGGVPYRIKEMVPAPSPSTLWEVTSQTRLRVFSSGSRIGTDIVILADSSGSMDIPDLTDYERAIEVPSGAQAMPPIVPPLPEPKVGFLQRILGMGGSSGNRPGFPSPAARQVSSRPPSVTRMKRIEALRKALSRLVDLRLETGGRTSRIALLSFTESARQRFPIGTGMKVFDDNAPQELIAEFQGAITLLTPGGGTDIGIAIHNAAELLHTHGYPGNEKLIVLISDGANWKPGTADRTGEIVFGVKDPVSLMDHLHREMKINIHAIGISRADLYEAWCRETYFSNPTQLQQMLNSPSLMPDHELLRELVSVGGGDPALIGDTDMLVKYFSGLASGVTRYMALPPAPALPALLPAEETELRKAAVQAAPNARNSVFQEMRETLAKRTIDLYMHSTDYANRVGLDPVFLLLPNTYRQFERLRKVTYDSDTFIPFLFAVTTLMESVNGQLNEEAALRFGKKTKPDFFPYPVMGVLDHLLQHPKMREVKQFRNRAAHPTDKMHDEQHLGRLLQSLVGKPVIADDDAEAWGRCQVEILTRFVSFLEDLNILLEEGTQAALTTVEKQIENQRREREASERQKANETTRKSRDYRGRHLLLVQ